MRRIIYPILICLLTLSGCIRISISTPSPTQPVETAAPSAIPTPVYPWTDESAVMNGICFEAAQDAAGKVFVLRNDGDLNNFYGGADNSQLCRHPVTRNAFDFSSGRVLAGLWSYGHGCTARHEVLGFTKDDTARQMTIVLHFVTEGACDYELVRPFWVGLDGIEDYTVNIIVQ